MHINKLIIGFIGFVTILLAGCELHPKYSPFDKDGIHIEVPEPWRFAADNRDVAQASRQLVFDINKQSHFSLNVIRKPYADSHSVNSLESYLNYYLTTLPETQDMRNVSISKSAVYWAGSKGYKVDIETRVMHEEKQHKVLLFFSTGKETPQVYAVFDILSGDILNVSREVEQILQSVTVSS